VCSELLEHLDEPAPALCRIAAALRPGGTIVVTVPSGKVFPTERAVGHVEHPEPEALRAWCTLADLEPVELRQWGWPGYLMLKRAANVNPERAMAAFGSGSYSWPKRTANDLAYFAVGLGSLRNHARGPQTILVARRRALMP
jgi:SAM-dependent methyltransferase